MSKTVRRLTAGIAAAVMCVGMAMPASALKHKYPNCGATTTVQKCGQFRTTYRDKHWLHTNTYCIRVACVQEHYYVCAGCGAYNDPGETKICERSHEYCPKELNLCK